MPDKYQLVGTYKNDNEKHCCTVRMFSPIISDEEREHRKDGIKKLLQTICQRYTGFVYPGKWRKKGKHMEIDKRIELTKKYQAEVDHRNEVEKEAIRLIESGRYKDVLSHNR